MHRVEHSVTILSNKRIICIYVLMLWYYFCRYQCVGKLYIYFNILTKPRRQMMFVGQARLAFSKHVIASKNPITPNLQSNQKMCWHARCRMRMCYHSQSEWNQFLIMYPGPRTRMQFHSGYLYRSFQKIGEKESLQTVMHHWHQIHLPNVHRAEEPESCVTVRNKFWLTS